MKNSDKKEFQVKFSNRQILLAETFIIILILLSTFIFIVLTFDISNELKKNLIIIENIILNIFIIEFLIRFFYERKKRKFFKNIYNIIDFIVILSFITIHSYFQFIRFFRFLKIFRYNNLYLEKTTQFFSGEFKFEKIFIIKIIILLLGVLVTFTSLILFAEKGINPDINNFFDSFYFTLVTVVSLGYGDIVPITILGKVIIIFTIVISYIIIPLNVAILVKYIIFNLKKQKIICRNCGVFFHEVDANYCKNCGHRLSKK